MRIDDACLVISNVDVSDDFYTATLGFEHRMRNVRFADFEFATGPRLAMWMHHSIAETVGATYPTGPGRPFRITLDLRDVSATTIADPDGFVLNLRPAADDVTRMSAIELSVSDLATTAGFLATLGFVATAHGDGVIEFATGEVTLTIREGELPPDDAVDRSHEPAVGAVPESTGRLMLAIELETGDDVDRLFGDLKARGLRDSGNPRVYEWGSRSAYFVDHDGYIWEIYAWVETPK